MYMIFKSIINILKADLIPPPKFMNSNSQQEVVG